MVKTIKKVLLFTFLLFSLGAGSSQNVKVPNEIIQGFQKGNSNLIIKYFNQNIEFVVDNKSNIYSKQQAEGILTHFFEKNKVVSFQTLHNGEKGSSLFVIGKLKTKNTNFRIHLLARELNNKIYIQQIRIDTE